MTHMAEKRNVYWVLGGKTEGKGPFKRSRYRFEVDIRVDMEERLWDGMDWIHLDQDTVVALPFEQSNEPLSSIKCRNFLTDLQCVRSLWRNLTHFSYFSLV